MSSLQKKRKFSKNYWFFKGLGTKSTNFLFKVVLLRKENEY